MIGPHSEVKGQNEMPGRIMINFETPDVKGEFDRLKALGATVEHEPYQPGPVDGEMWLATLADPDGPGRPLLGRGRVGVAAAVTAAEVIAERDLTPSHNPGLAVRNRRCREGPVTRPCIGQRAAGLPAATR